MRVYEDPFKSSDGVKIITQIVFYHRGYYYNDEDNKIVKPHNPYDHHLFRFVVTLGHLEVVRMQPELIDIDCIKDGFMVYENYARVAVRRTDGENPAAYQGIPTYSRDYGAIIIDTPIRKHGSKYSARCLVYDGENSIHLADK